MNRTQTTETIKKSPTEFLTITTIKEDNIIVSSHISITIKKR